MTDSNYQSERKTALKVLEMARDGQSDDALKEYGFSKIPAYIVVGIILALAVNGALNL